MPDTTFIYLFQPDAYSEPYVFADQDSAIAFAEARGATDLDVLEQVVIDRDLAEQMTADTVADRDEEDES